MRLSTLGQIQPEQKQAAIIATALAQNPVKLGDTANPVAAVLGLLGVVGVLLYVASSND